ncbi:hypothetical protein HN604_01275 [archaeon]|jgi:predicted transcriptional regulator|nr:hypothetical protein [archaeon]MBT6606042.1 hypothetical protein [archaeon]MBT7251685.1 hypothetical protein [archaeon]MBT7660695.1 hypothetical protein [archaeon]
MDNIAEVKKKKELRQLPDQIIEKALQKSNNNIKDARAYLRKYFGLFLTNKIIKGKIGDEEILKVHISSKKRDYEKFYEEIFENIKKPKSIIDLGAGVNGFSYKYLEKVVGTTKYIAIEASGQLVSQMNKFFKENKLNAKAFCEDITNIQSLKKIISKTEEPRTIFLFQVIDALESFEKNLSKEFIEEISHLAKTFVITLPLESIGKRKQFNVQRKWLIDFLEEKFTIQKDFKLFGERILVCDTKKIK